MIVLIDNYDSFTYNLYHYLGFFDSVVVFRNTQPLEKIKTVRRLKGIVISPGPSHPKNSLVSLEVIDFFKGRLPILGVCLGMQAIGFYFGATIRKARRIMHGKVDRIIVTQRGPLFEGLPDEFSATRYHSLVVDDLPADFCVEAKAKSDSEVMAMENRSLVIFGVQFHPESYMSQFGLQLVRNFVKGVCLR